MSKINMSEKVCDADTKELYDAVEKVVYSYEITDFNTAKKRKYPFDYLHTKNIEDMMWFHKWSKDKSEEKLISIPK